MCGPCAVPAEGRLLPDGARMHLHHGPIDLIVGWDGPARDAAFDRAHARFETVLDELVQELPDLRRDYPPEGWAFSGVVAQRMGEAVAPFKQRFITPMAAVAGAVAEEVLSAMKPGEAVDRAYVNNGGDIAFHLTPAATLTAAIAGTTPDALVVRGSDTARGIATSGQGGRSQSLGIAESVTVLARSAARADAAATLIANTVDLPGHASIRRIAAERVSVEPDLWGQMITADVGPLTPEEVDNALMRGLEYAQILVDSGLIDGALLRLRSQSRIAGKMAETRRLRQPERD